MICYHRIIDFIPDKLKSRSFVWGLDFSIINYGKHVYVYLYKKYLPDRKVGHYYKYIVFEKLIMLCNHILYIWFYMFVILSSCSGLVANIVLIKKSRSLLVMVLFLYLVYFKSRLEVFYLILQRQNCIFV